MTTVLTTVINIVLTAAGIYSLFLLILGGFQYITSMGDPRPLELAREKITASILTLGLTTLLFIVLTLLGPLLSSLSVVIPREFASGILVTVSILFALFTTWGTIRFLYIRQQQRSQALISEIKKYDTEFFEYVKRQLAVLENQEEESKNE